MKSKTGKGISAMRMAQKDGTEEGVFANDEGAEEEVLANEEYITAWLDKVGEEEVLANGRISQRG